MIQVLLIDDDRFSLEGLKTMLPWEKHGMKIVGEAVNGRDGLAFLEKQNVDLVMLDLAMPVMDGLTFIRACREKHPDVQYVVMTFHESFEYIQEALRLGVVDYISKLKLEEEDQDSLLARIADTVKQRKTVVLSEERSGDVQKIAEKLRTPLWLCDDLCFWEIEQIWKQKKGIDKQLESLLREVIIRLETSGKVAVPEYDDREATSNAIGFLKNCRDYVSENAAKGMPDTTEARLVVAASLMNRSYDQSVHISDIGTAAGLSRSYLSSCFSRFFGITLNEFLRRKRIYESMKLIENGKDSLGDIALKVGYDSYQYYKKMFMEVRGETPKEFQNKCINLLDL